MDTITDYEAGISAIDSGFFRPGFDAVHLIVHEGRAALVDTSVNAGVPRVLQALAAKGLAPEQVDYICLTHIHLDHAGAASALMRRLPNARLTVHPRGARHMADPSRLVAGTVGVYGHEYTARMYGEILPIPAERIVETPDGARVSLAGRDLVFLDTPGHARHHVCILDTATGHLFTGDTFGLSYPELTVRGRRSIFPTTTPIQFDPPAQAESVRRILALEPAALYLTHFGQVRDVKRLGEDLLRLIDEHARLGERERGQGAGAARHERLKAGVESILVEEARRQGWPYARRELVDLFEGDIELNAQGIGSWLDSSSTALR